MKKRLFVCISLITLAMICLLANSAYADEDIGIEYSSVGMIQDKLYFLGDDLHCFEMDDSQLVNISDESGALEGFGEVAANLMMISGGTTPHILDVNSGDVYVWEKGGGHWLAKLESSIFNADDSDERRQIMMPTISQTENGTVLYLLASMTDQPTQYTLEYFNLSNGDAGKVPIDHVIMIANYRDGKLIALVGKTDLYRLVLIDSAANRTDTVLFEDNRPQYRVTGIAYDLSSDTFVMATEDHLYQIKEQAMVDTYVYLPAIEEREYRNDYHCFVNGKYVFINKSSCYAFSLKHDENKAVLKFANSGMTDEIRGFMRRNPNINVSYNDDFVWDNQTIITSLLTQNSDVDVITIYAGASLSAIKAKKYYADLSGSSILMDAVQLMYPQIASALLDNEQLAAFPRDMSISCWLVDESALNNLGFSMEGCTIEKWLDFVEEYAQDFDVDESSYALFPGGFDKSQLVYEILMEYIVESETLGELRFDNRHFQEIVSRILKLPQKIFLSNHDEGESVQSYDAGLPPLFVVNTFLSPNAYIGFYENYHPQYFAPPSFFSGSATRGTLSVYLVNPYSAHKEAALAFLEYCAQNQTAIQRFYLEQAFDQPIPNQEFVDYKESIDQAIAELNSLLSNGKPEDRADIEMEIEEQKINLEYAKKNEWFVSDSDISALKAIMPSLTFMPNSLCFNDSSYSTTTINLYDLVQKAMQKETNLSNLFNKTQQKYEMMRMESN